jgi:putative ABC transport system permease protein
MLKDLNYALRTLLRSPGFTLAAILSLALGLGANTALFSAVDAVLLRPLPYPNPERLVLVWSTMSSYPRMPSSIPDFKAYRDDTRSFDGMAAYFTTRRNVALEGAEPERLMIDMVTHDLSSVLGVRPQLGRFLEAGDEEWGRHRVVVLSWGFWQRAFHGDPAALGKTVTVDGDPWTVVGVMPRGFNFDDPDVQLWAPISFPANNEMAARGNYLQIVARIKAGVTEPQARDDLARVAAAQRAGSGFTRSASVWAMPAQQFANAAALPQNIPDNTGTGATLESLRDAIAGPVRPALLVLLGAVGLVLLIACANLGNLLLARGAARGREIAVRAALGATRARLIRQLLTESVLLAVAGGIVGSLLAVWALSGVSVLGGEALATLPKIRLDLRVLAFTAALSLVTGILFGLAPALLLSRHTLSEALKESAPSVSPRSGRLRSGLVVAEVALSVALLAGAGLLLRSLDKLRHVDPGFRGEQVMTAGLRISERYGNDKARLAFLEELVRRVEALPGVSSAGTSTNVPLSRSTWGKWITAEGEPEPATLDAVQNCLFQLVSGHFFQALGLQLVHGRFPADGREPAIVINESAERHLFGGKSAIGRRVWLGPPERLLPDLTRPYPRYTVVGVVRDVRTESLGQPARAEAWLRQEQSDDGLASYWLLTRFSGAPGPLMQALRATLRSVDSDIALADMKTMAERTSSSVAQQRFSALLLALFAGLALTLAVLGLYAVMAYSVAQRTREIGVRMALGAASGDVLRLVFRQGFVLIGSGLLLGVFGSLAASRAISALLFGISPTDPWTFAGVVVVQLAVGAIALYLPARRASRLEPAIALRTE